jgi:hypothetical protein
MRLFDKHYPNATKLGVLICSLAGAPIGALTMWVYTGVIGHSEEFTSGLAIFSAVVGALAVGSIYWQGWPD